MVYKINFGEHPIIDTLDNFLKNRVQIIVFLKAGQHVLVNGDCNMEIINNNFIQFTTETNDRVYGIFNLDEIIGVSRYEDY